MTLTHRRPSYYEKKWVGFVEGDGGSLRYLVGCDAPDQFSAGAILIKQMERDGSGDTLARVVSLSELLEPFFAAVENGDTVKASWKTEDDEFGPMALTHQEVYDADPVSVARKGQLGVPYGYQPQGQQKLPWMHVTEARRIAADLGVELWES